MTESSRNVLLWRPPPRFSVRRSIHSLPDELLVEIFARYGQARARARKYLIDLEDCYGDRSWVCGTLWTPLMLVCRSWRDLAVNTPCLWHRINVWASTEWLALALERSRSAPLDILLHDLTTAREIIPMLLPHAKRIRKLLFPPLCMLPRYNRVYAGYQPRDISWSLPLLTASLPQLNELVLPIEAIRATDNLAHSAVDVSETSLPALRILRITCAVLPWALNTVARLTCLDLCACVHDGPRISTHQFLDILERCDALKELRLTDRFVSSTLTPGAVMNTDSSRILELRQLRKLALGDVPAVTSWLLSCLKFTRRVSVSVCGWLPEPREAAHNAFHSLLPPGTDISRFFPTSTPRYGKIDTYEEEAEIQVGLGAEAVFTLKIKTPAPHSNWYFYYQQALDEFAALFSRFPLQTIDVKGDLDDVPPQSWHTFLSHFPALRAIESNAEGSPASFLKALKHTPMSPVDDSDGPCAPVCPQLRSLSFVNGSYYGGEIELMVATLHRRAFYSCQRLKVLAFHSNAADDRAREEKESETVLYRDELGSLCSKVYID